MAHASHGALADRPAPYGDRGFAVYLDRFESESVGMLLISLGQHIEERIHLNMEKGLDGYRLQRLGNRTLADAADAIEENDPREPVGPLPRCLVLMPCHDAGSRIVRRRFSRRSGAAA